MFIINLYAKSYQLPPSKRMVKTDNMQLFTTVTTDFNSVSPFHFQALTIFFQLYHA
jgi:hypothetical protein